MKLPQVHFAVNVGGVLAVIGSALGFIVAHQTCISDLFPQADALAVTAVIGAIAAFLPTKPKA